MILGTKGRYAVMAMADLALRGSARPVCLAEIAQSQQIPLPYLEQIFGKLKKSGLLTSARGPGGGYRLARPVQDIPISEIVMAVDESIKMTRCGKESHAGCMGKSARCITHDLWEGLGEQIYGYLHSVSLADVCQSPSSAVFSRKMPLKVANHH